MKILTAYFKGLIGVYRPSGRKEIFIDFTKNKNKITIIMGPNGAGKSTIFKALNPLPDLSSMYLDNESGQKIIEYQDNDDIYKIRIDYPVSMDRKRLQTKAYLYKRNIYSNEEIELNPNGNITSFKSQLYDNFNLDPNFVSLSQLSMDDKGIVDKTPTERKKFVSGILESLDVYNNIYKTLSKRSSNFRVMINSIIAKIDSIGDEEKLKSELVSIESRINRIDNRKLELDKILANCEASINIIDPDGTIQQLYSSLLSEYNILNNDKNTIINLLGDTNISLEDITQKIEDIKNQINDYQNQNNILRSKNSDLLVTREEESRAIQLKHQRVLSLTTDINYDATKKQMKELKSNLDSYIKIFKEIGIENFKITKDEYIIGLNTLKELKDMVSRIREQEYLSNILSAIDNIRNNINTINIMNDLNTKYHMVIEEKNICNETIKYNEGLLDRISILENRPKECYISTCSFIVDALEAQDKHPEEVLAIEYKKLDNLHDTISKYEKDIENMNSIIRIENDIKIIIRNIKTNSSILEKLPNGYIFGDFNTFLNMFYDGSDFNEIDDLYQYIRYANIFEQYNYEKELYIKLESQFKIYESKNEILEELNTDINNLENKLSTITNDLTQTNFSIRKNSEVLERLQREKLIFDERFSSISKLKRINESLKDISSKMEVVSGNISIIQTSIQSINQYNLELKNIQIEVTPLKNRKDNIQYSIKQMEEYKKELQSYKDKFQYIEMIKKYSSPSTGIQTIFMQLYMGKTLEIANRLLSLLFDGRMTLVDYVINDDEFRIPCKSAISNIINDDIKSCSSAEKAMISMIISFSLLFQSSTKYNILKLDEIDSMLDIKNKSNFPIVVGTIMDEMKVDNCIMVTHSSEFEMSNVDIIWLSIDGYEDKEIPSGNIIFKY